MHVPLLQIIFFLAVATAPPNAREIQVTAPHFSAHWVLTDKGWQGGQYHSKATWKLRTKLTRSADDKSPAESGSPRISFDSLLPDWTRAVVVEGGNSPGLFPVNGYVEPALGRNWTTGLKVDLPLQSSFEKTAAGFAFTMRDGNGQERQYQISYNNDGSPYTDTVICDYLDVSGPNRSVRREVGLRVKSTCADHLPPWTPLDDTPIPVSVAQASELVAQATRKMPVPPQITDIILSHHVWDDDGRDFWYYDFCIASQEPHTFGTGLHIGVLFDGTVLFPEPNPWPSS